LRFISHHGKEEIQAQTPTEPPQSVWPMANETDSDILATTGSVVTSID
jgi:hypothetical protein